MTLIEELVLAAIGRASAQRQVPESTYRLQFHKGFTFSDAAAIVPYLHDLGITHVYASPYLTARPGSMHGYDVIDPTRLNPELGGESAFSEFLEALQRSGLHQLLDTVPNHMGVGTNQNAWWNDVLENGRESRYRDYFDIAWTASPRASLMNRVLLPVLGDHYGAVLSRGELKLVYESGRYMVAYFDHRFPLNRRSIDEARKITLRDGAQLVDALNGNIDLLDKVLLQQHYRLAYWKTAPDEINYRRFFDINDLAAIRSELPQVFEDTHRFTMTMALDGVVAGLRADHPDGLWDPEQYFQRLQETHVLNHARAIQSSDTRFAGVDEEELRSVIAQHLATDSRKPLYVLAEKILGIDETLPQSWAIDGTSGYDALNVINGLFVDSRNANAMEKVYREAVPDAPVYEELVYTRKLLILTSSMASELHILALLLDQIAQAHRDSRDFTLSTLTAALRNVIACFPVYRSYITARGMSDADRGYIEHACAEAARRAPNLDAASFDFIRRVLLQEAPAGRDQMLRFAGKFQQLTAPATAKGVEDTAFYLYNRLISLNEVGGEPSHFGLAPERVHHFFSERQRLWPHALNALSTHDTKRSEDVRARINVLSEIPDLWRERVQTWATMNAPHRAQLAGRPAPLPNDEYMLYQTLAGAWPLDESPDKTFVSRIHQYAQKALREAKQNSSWTLPNEPYEEATLAFVSSILAADSAFRRDFAEFHQRHIATAGMINALSQTVLRLTFPGVPDTYQGTELWDLSLVDPDNRRPVDFQHRQILLSDTARGFDIEMLQNWRDGRVKLLVTSRILRALRDNARLFSSGGYDPIKIIGHLAQHVFAFSRRAGDSQALVVVARLPAALLRDDGPLLNWDASTKTTLEFAPKRKMTCVLTGHEYGEGVSLDVAELLSQLPACVLISR